MVKADASPFDLHGESAAGGDGRVAALCLHGLTGTPYEVRPLAEALALRGIRAFGPALPGHNETPEVLARTSHREWLDAARDHCAELRKQHECVFGVGMSMGGLVTLWLAANEGLDAAVVVGTPLRLRQKGVFLVPLAKHLMRYLSKSAGSDIRDPASRARHPGYSVMPLAGIHELQRLQRVVRPQLSRVTSPVLVAHGVHDRTAHPDDARAVFDGIRSEVKELLLLENSAHIVPVDHDGPMLARAGADFLARQAGSG